MKKLHLFCTVYFVLCTSVVFAYTQTDVDNANFLAEKGLIVSYTNTPENYRLDDTITRAESMGIALKIKWIVLPNYQCKWYFADVRNHDWICRAVELAADAWIVSRANTKARPQDSITRAEALAIIMNASGNKVGMWGYTGYRYYFDANLYWEGGIWFRNAHSFWATWQAETFYQYIRTILQDDSLLKQNPRASTPATRAEVFGFAKSILWGKVTAQDQNWDIYNNETIGVTFSYPDTWKILEDEIYKEYIGDLKWYRVKVGDDSISEKPKLLFEVDPDWYWPIFSNKYYTLLEDTNWKIVISNISQYSEENTNPGTFTIRAHLDSQNKHSYSWTFTAKSRESESIFIEILKTFQF